MKQSTQFERMMELNQRYVLAMQWLGQRGMQPCQAIISEAGGVQIFLKVKPTCNMLYTQTLKIEGTASGRVVHLHAPLKGCGVYWNEALQ